MSKIAEFFRSGHIQVALATGASIISLAYFSKRVLPDPMSYLALAGPPFLMVIYEALASNEKYAHLARSSTWVAAILLATAVDMVLHLI
ncbi:MAG: hypothetical protein JXQ27_10420 [Acidobacteria bacterium]|nr:hypothetical protein [Acidobacteriota bacterium]